MALSCILWITEKSWIPYNGSWNVCPVRKSMCVWFSYLHPFLVISLALGCPVLWCDHRLGKVLEQFPGFVLHMCMFVQNIAPHLCFDSCWCYVRHVTHVSILMQLYSFPFASRFFKELEDRHQQNIVINDISDIITRHTQSNFDPYVTYCSNEVYQQRTLQRLLWVLHTYTSSLLQLKVTSDFYPLAQQIWSFLWTENLSILYEAFFCLRVKIKRVILR